MSLTELINQMEQELGEGYEVIIRPTRVNKRVKPRHYLRPYHDTIKEMYINKVGYPVIAEVVQDMIWKDNPNFEKVVDGNNIGYYIRRYILEEIYED